MAINLMCSTCKSTSSLKSRYCKRCGQDLRKRTKYRVVVNGHDGKRVSKVLDSISMAKKLESKLKTQYLEKKLTQLADQQLGMRYINRYMLKKHWNCPKKFRQPPVRIFTL